MRKFEEADRKRKNARIQLEENPGGLSGEQVLHLENAVKSSLKDGYLPCPVAWKIARESGIPKIAVGEVADRLGIRVTECQLGYFKVDKTPYEKSAEKGKPNNEIITQVKALKDNDNLTCDSVFRLAKEMKLTPMAIADAANQLDLKIRSCQLGCF